MKVFHESLFLLDISLSVNHGHPVVLGDLCKPKVIDIFVYYIVMSVGIALLTKFVINCFGWKNHGDDEGDTSNLLYRFWSTPTGTENTQVISTRLSYHVGSNYACA